MDLKFAFKAHNPPGDKSAFRHTHEVDEIVYFLHGKGTTTIREKTYAVKNNCFSLIPAGVEHDQISESTIDTICLGLAEGGMQGICGMWVDPDGHIKSTLVHLMDELSQKKPGYSMITQGLIYTAMGLMQRAIQRSAPMDRKQTLIDRAIHIIEDREGNLSINEITSQLFISKEYLRHLFRHYTGMSPMQTIIEARIMHAKNLLHNNNLTVADVAEECGFENPYYFSRLFKKVTGQTPSDFRK